MHLLHSLLAIYRVTGDSMLPVLRDGDYVLASSLIKPKINALVVVHHSTYGVMVKRVSQISETHILLTGENQQSLSPEKMGWVDLGQVRGCVLKHFKPN